MKCLKRATALLLCLIVMLSLFPVESRAAGPELSDYWIYEKEDLPMLYTAASEYLINYGSSSITFCFSKKLVDKYTVDKLVGLAMKAGHMVSVDGFNTSYSTPSDGTLRVELSNLKIRSGEKMLEAWLFGDKSSLTSEEKKCLKKVIKVMDGLMEKYPKTSLELETAIYDYICEHVHYKTYSDSSKREKCTSACNAFMNGWGNCQAYSDLFRLMATIGGFNTGLISGETRSAHMWNWIGTWFDGEYRVYMVDVTYGDHGKKKKADHYYLNFGQDRVDDHTWPKELFLYDEFEAKTKKSCTFYNGSKAFTAKKLDDAAKKCAKLTKNGKKRVEFLVYQKGIGKKQIQAAFNKYLRISGEWHFIYYKHDKGVVVVFWR